MPIPMPGAADAQHVQCLQPPLLEGSQGCSGCLSQYSEESPSASGMVGGQKKWEQLLNTLNICNPLANSFGGMLLRQSVLLRQYRTLYCKMLVSSLAFQ